MIEFKVLALDKIYIAPDRLRKLDEGFVEVLRGEVEAGQFVDPILVRKTPNRKGFSYELVDGEHRIAERRLAGVDEIACVVVAADKDEAKMLEAGANLFRQMSILDRALAINGYREAWQRKHGNIQRGNPELSNRVKMTQLEETAKDQRVKVSLWSDEDNEKVGFNQSCAERMGISVSAVKRSVYIAKRLPADLVEKLRHTEIADSQIQLLNIARLVPEKLLACVDVIDLAEGDYDELMRLLEEKKKAQDPKMQALSRMIDSWTRVSGEHKWHVLELFGITDLLNEEQEKKLEEILGSAKPSESMFR